MHCDPAQGQTASDLSKDFGRFCREDDETSSTYLSAEQIGRKLKQLGIESGLVSHESMLILEEFERFEEQAQEK
ncbi:hypothetical protein EBT25_13855 [bacterium]|nr:hypothetical protein [bacterium]